MNQPNAATSTATDAVGFLQVYCDELDQVCSRDANPTIAPRAALKKESERVVACLLRCTERLESAKLDVLKKLASRANLDGDGDEKQLRTRLLNWVHNRLLQRIQAKALSTDLCGLAISGGGIRSATFALGVLQGLAATKMLPRFDYLSTVSGGGYIGSWLMSWIREKGLPKVEEGLQPPRLRASTHPDPDPPEIRHIRRYSNYLAPRPGLFTVDGWTLVAIFARNMLLNQAVLFFAAFALILGLRLVVEFFSLVYRQGASSRTELLVASGAGLAIITALIANWWFVRRHRRTTEGLVHPYVWRVGAVPWVVAAAFGSLLFVCHESNTWFESARSTATLLKTVAACVVSQCLWGIACLLLPCATAKGTTPTSVAPKHDWIGGGLFGAIGGGIGGFLLYAFWGLLLTLTSAGLPIPVVPGPATTQLSATAVLTVPDATSTELIVKTTKDSPGLRGWDYGSTRVATVVTFGPPGCMLIFILVNFLQIGFCGARLNEIERERWSAVNARLAIVAAGWLGLFAAVVYGPWLLGLMWLNSTGGWRWLTGIAGAGWFGTLLAGLKAGQSAQTGANQQSRWVDLLAKIAPAVFLATFWIGLCTITVWIGYDLYEFCTPNDDVNHRFVERLPKLLNDLDRIEVRSIWGGDRTVIVLFALGMIVTSILTWLLGRWIGVNTFTLQHLYQNRLVRCYLGASRGAQRTPDPLVNFDARDDYPFSTLDKSSADATTPLLPTERGPYYIVNGALNQKASSRSGRHGETTSAAEQEAEKLQFVERQAEAFIFTSKYCGSESTGYCPSDEFAENVSLGTAVAVSGAAVSPNSGYHSSPAVTALLTLFNVRLGAWFGHPAKPTRKDANPGAQCLLFAEMRGKTGSDSKYVYVSDGGHFENMGVYELIRRRCRFILAIDSGADPEFHENIGRLVRLVRIDFGIYIELDPATITPGADGLCQSHIIVGRIHYGDVHGTGKATQSPRDPRYSREQNHGIILWIKNSLTGDEPGDVRNYKTMNPTFPYETTLDQFFSESQFESYRALGVHALLESLRFPWVDQHEPVDADGDKRAGTQSTQSGMRAVCSNPGQLSGQRTEDLFQLTYDYWLVKPDRTLTAYLDQNANYIRIMESLRQDPHLQRLAAELYGDPVEQELAKSSLTSIEEHRAETLMANELFTLLANVWFALDFERHSEHPQHEGWVGVFKHWCGSPTLRKAWKQKLNDGKTSVGLHLEYNPSFTRFVQQYLEAK